MKEIVAYLQALEQNNNREWFHLYKKERQQANEQFLKIVQTLIFDIGQTDSSILFNEAKDLTFKQVRDTRFSHDKSPYHPAFRAHIAPKGKLPIPVGYYLMIKPNDRSFLGGGLFADMFKEATAMVRNYIAENGDEWEGVITDPVFSRFFTVKGTALKNVPRGYDAAHPQAEYLKNKSWFLEYPISDAELMSEDFITVATERFAVMQPFNAFLNRALAGFEMPKRP